MRTIDRRLTGRIRRLGATALAAAVVVVPGAGVPAHAATVAATVAPDGTDGSPARYASERTAPAALPAGTRQASVQGPLVAAVSWVYIWNKNSGLYLGVSESRTDNGAPIIQFGWRQPHTRYAGHPV